MAATTRWVSLRSAHLAFTAGAFATSSDLVLRSPRRRASRRTDEMRNGAVATHPSRRRFAAPQDEDCVRGTTVTFTAPARCVEPLRNPSFAERLNSLYLPCQFGGRLLRKASMPSRKSSDM